MRKNSYTVDLLDLGHDAPGWAIVQTIVPCGHGFCALLGRPCGRDVPVLEWGPELVKLEVCPDAVAVAWENMRSVKAEG